MLRTALFLFRSTAPVLVAAAMASGQSPIDGMSVEDVAFGKRLFDSQCSRCHGVGGGGAEGPSLNRPVLSNAQTDEALYTVIRNGIPRTEMPGAWPLSVHEAWQVAAYVRSLSAVEEEALSGDADRGHRLFEEKGACTICHMVDGDGGSLGPDLSGVGARRGAAHLKQALVEPGASVADRYLLVHATTSGGETIKGVRVNEDSFSIQLIDESSQFRSLDKSQLSALSKRFGESLMPSYENELSDDELDDIVAYLASLKETR